MVARVYFPALAAIVLATTILVPDGNAEIQYPYGNPTGPESVLSPVYYNPLPYQYQVNLSPSSVFFHPADPAYLIEALAAQGISTANGWTINRGGNYTLHYGYNFRLDTYAAWAETKPEVTQGSLYASEASMNGYGGAVIGLHYMPAGSDPVGADVHWLQLIESNVPGQNKGAYVNGEMSYYIDNWPNPDGNPFYDYSYAANASDFLDRPSRQYSSNSSWKAWTFIATGDLNAKDLNIYQNGVYWGFYDPIALPEPNMFVLFLSGISCVGLLWLIRRRIPIQSNRASRGGAAITLLLACVMWMSCTRAADAERHYGTSSGGTKQTPSPTKATVVAKPTSGAKPMKERLLTGPLAFKDPDTGILIFVENDRQHVSAIDKNGKILWHRNIVVEEGIQRFRADVRPAIGGVSTPIAWQVDSVRGKGASGPFVGIGFTDHTFGLVEVRSGVYWRMGSD